MDNRGPCTSSWVKGGAKRKRVLPQTEQALALVPPCVLTPTNQCAL